MDLYILPENYPVIFKPIINLYGMSRFEIVNNEEEYYDKLEDGLFWSPYFTGDHYTIDFIIINGVINLDIHQMLLILKVVLNIMNLFQI